MNHSLKTMKVLYAVFISSILILTRFAVFGYGKGAESRLLERLLQDYSTNERPVKNAHDPIHVKVDLGLKQIINMEEKKQVLVWNGWVRQLWRDVHLIWNVSVENGVKSLAVNKQDIWVPDLAVYNNAKAGFQLISDEAEEKIIVDNNGNCIWMTPFVFKTTCMLDMAYFPFDSQKCDFEVGSWAYTGDKFNISVNKATSADITSEYTTNGVWSLKELITKHCCLKLANFSDVKFNTPCDVMKKAEFQDAFRSILKTFNAYFGKTTSFFQIGYYACCVESYPSVIYTVSLRRRSKFYLLNFFVPSCWITLLATVSFWLPQTSGERVTLLITNLLSLAFFLMIVSNIVPPTSNVSPLLEVYLTAVFIEICLALVARTFIDKTKRRYKSPGVVTATIVNKFLAKLLRVKPKAVENISQVRQHHFSPLELESINIKLSPGNSCRTTRNQSNEDYNSNNQREIVTSESELNRGRYNVNERILSALRTITESVEETSKSRSNQRELNYFLLNLDEFFFWLFSLTLFLTLVVFFLTPPQIKM